MLFCCVHVCECMRRRSTASTSPLSFNVSCLLGMLEGCAQFQRSCSSRSTALDHDRLYEPDMRSGHQSRHRHVHAPTHTQNYQHTNNDQLQDTPAKRHRSRVPNGFGCAEWRPHFSSSSTFASLCLPCWLSDKEASQAYLYTP